MCLSHPFMSMAKNFIVDLFGFKDLMASITCQSNVQGVTLCTV